MFAGDFITDWNLFERDLKFRKKIPKLTSKNPMNPSKTNMAPFIPCVIFEFGSPKQTAQATTVLFCKLKKKIENNNVRRFKTCLLNQVTLVLS